MTNPVVNFSPFAGAGAQFFDNNGVPLAGGLLYTYASGTTTPQITYTTASANTANSNPIVLDSSGRTTQEIWLLNGYSYKFVLQTSASVQIGSYDNIPSISTNIAIINDASSVAYEQGTNVTAGNFIVGDTYLITAIGTTNFTSIGASSNTIGLLFTATGVGSGTGTAQLSRTVQNKLQEYISVKDFGATGNAVLNNSTNVWSGTDDTAAIQAAINATAPTGLVLHIPAGNYLVSSELTTTGFLNIRGDGNQVSVLVSSCSGYTIRGQGGVHFEGFAIQGSTNSESSVTASGWDSYNAASHNWILRDMRFQFLDRAMRFSESYIGQAYDIYVNDCGTTTDYAISIENATNEISFENLQCRSNYGGVGSGPNGQWAGKQIYVGPGTKPVGGAGVDCLGINFVNLGIEHIGVQDAANFNNAVSIIGGYTENENYPGAYNYITFNAPATVIGGFWNSIFQYGVPLNEVVFISSQFGISNYASGINTSFYRGAIPLATNGSNIPFIQTASGYNSRISGPGNFNSQTVGTMPSGLNYYNQGGGNYTALVVSDGYFNPRSLKMTNGGTVDYGGAIGLPYVLTPTTRSDVYGWAIVKMSNSSDQFVLSLGGPDSQIPADTYFSPLTGSTWYFVQIGPINPYNDGYLWVRMYGNGGGAPSTGASFVLDSWGVSFGALDLTNIYNP